LWRTKSLAKIEYNRNQFRQKGPFKIDPWASFTKRIFIQLLGGNVVKFEQKPYELKIEDYEIKIIEEHLIDILGNNLTDCFLKAIQESDINQLLALIPILQRTVILNSFFKQNPIDTLITTFESIRNRLSLVFGQNSVPIIALVGPDGVGKTTLINSIEKLNLPFRKNIVRHWRPDLLPELSFFLNPFRKRNHNQIKNVIPRRKAGKFHYLRLFYYFFDFTIGFWWKDILRTFFLDMIIYDRCALDMSVDPVRYGLSSKKGTRLLWQIIPKPDSIILLYDIPERINSRKNELDIIEIDRQLKEWLKLAGEGIIDAIIYVDSSPDIAIHYINNLIVEAMIKKHASTVSEYQETIQWLNTVLNTGNQVKFNFKEEYTDYKKIYTFNLLYLKQGRTYLLPMTSSKIEKKSLEIYNAQNLKAKIARRLLETGLILDITQHFLPKIHMIIKKEISDTKLSNILLLEHIKEIMGYKTLYFAISSGTPGHHRKPVIQMITDDGIILGYVKIGWNEGTNTLVQNEARILREINTSFNTFLVPRVIYSNSWNGRYLCIQSSPEGKIETAPQTMNPNYMGIIKEMSNFHIRKIPLKESLFWKNLIKNIDKIYNHYYLHILKNGIKKIDEWIGNETLPFHFRHGDFAPWNAKIVNGQLFLFDWEYAELEALPALDLFHFFIQTLWLLKKYSPGDIYKTFTNGQKNCEKVRKYLQSLNINVDLQKPLLLLYLLDRFSFYASMESTNVQSLRYLSTMINLTILQMEEV
ncbi:MAG: hypothetical protein ABRQ38_22735, partial [Candidatus Eremiobacterota bacterium]